MSDIFNRVGALHDAHTTSGSPKDTPNVIIASPDVANEIKAAIGGASTLGTHYRGMEILETPGEDILIVGFTEN